MDWVKTNLRKPPEGVEVLTKIDDGKEVRNEQSLKRQGLLWFTRDGIYVYYTPTHWKYKY
jgi:hypothetical protein